MSGKHQPEDEREALAMFLDLQRSALVRKIEGVSEADARVVPTASSLSLLAILKHSCIWEQRWFQGIVAGRPLADGWPDQESDAPDHDFLVGEEDTVEAWPARYREAAAESRSIVTAM